MSTTSPELYLKSVEWASGETFTMIVNEDGIPLVAPTVFALIDLRAQGLAHSTIVQAMYAVRILIQFLNFKKIDIHERIHVHGRLFTIGEVEELVSVCKLHLSEIKTKFANASAPARVYPQNRFKNGSRRNLIERFRMKTKKNLVSFVERETGNIRLTYIARYLRWVVDQEFVRADPESTFYLSARENARVVIDTLRAKRIQRASRKLNRKRRGLTEDVIKRLHEVLDPSSPENPWRPGFNRYRNRLYIYWLLEIALRKGEALALTLEDINFGTGVAEVIRRPDNPRDPRKFKPLVKTKERVLRISGSLLDYTEEYLEMRRKFLNLKRKHEYLFVSSRNGEPLSQSAARDIFYTLRKKVPDIPKNLSAHLLRHTWNTLFTNHAFESNMSDKNREDFMRNQNGWSDKSKMPNYYSVGAIEKKAQQESLKTQAKIHGFRKRS